MGSARTSVSATVGSLRAEPALVRVELSPRSTGLSLDANRGENCGKEGAHPVVKATGQLVGRACMALAGRAPKRQRRPGRYSCSRSGSAEVARGALERAC